MISVSEPALVVGKFVSCLKSIKIGHDGANNTDEDLLSAAELNDIIRLRKCIDNHVYINCKDVDGGFTALHAAAGEGNFAIVTVLLNTGANVVASDNERQTALHYAARGNHVPTIHLILDKQANINAVDIFGRTPLFYACKLGHYETVAALIERGCDTTVPSKTRDDHLHIAAQVGQ